MTWAYGFNKNGGCSFVSYGDFISGGPAWIKSDRFAIQALMPEDSAEYTTSQNAEVFGLGGTRIQKRPDGSVSQHFVARNTSMTYVALMLGLVTRRPVVDRTGLTGEFTFDLEFAPEDPGLGESSAASVFTAIQEQLGLKLELAKVPAEILVIDRAERPSEN
jgi:uncharacterized protein (TIGR03435 family)